MSIVMKSPKPSRSENSNPNQCTVSVTSPLQKKSPAIGNKPEKWKKFVAKSLLNVSPRNKIQERKFVIVKKNPKKTSPSASEVTCKCKDKKMDDNLKKCPCIAYQTLRASQEDFSRNRSLLLQESVDLHESDESKRVALIEEEEEKKLNEFLSGEDEIEEEVKTLETLESNGDSLNSLIIQESEDFEGENEMGSSKIKRRRAKVHEEARSSVPDLGSGKVLHLVKAFESLRFIPNRSTQKEGGGEEGGEVKEKEEEEDVKKGVKWALPGIHQPKVFSEKKFSTDSFSPTDKFAFKLGTFDIGSSASSSFDSSQGSRNSTGGGRRSRRNSSDSSGASGLRRWKKKQQLKVTSQKPFKLRTEQRGKYKEEVFIKKVHQMFNEEEKQRIPIAQGLPWTTDEPEHLVKPPVKDITRPVDLKLHSDVRAVERADFDCQVAEKLSLLEQYRMEKDRQQKLEEEEEIKRLRKELVPRAQPMPYFDRPFIPKRSVKNPTIPKEPKFHASHHKRIKCMSWSDVSSMLS